MIHLPTKNSDQLITSTTTVCDLTSKSSTGGIARADAALSCHPQSRLPLYHLLHPTSPQFTAGVAARRYELQAGIRRRTVRIVALHTAERSSWQVSQKFKKDPPNYFCTHLPATSFCENHDSTRTVE